MNELEFGVKLHRGSGTTPVSSAVHTTELVLSAAELQAVSTSSHEEYLWDALHACFVLIRDQNNPVTIICHLLRDL